MYKSSPRVIEIYIKKVADLGTITGASIDERDISIAHRLPGR